MIYSVCLYKTHADVLPKAIGKQISASNSNLDPWWTDLKLQQ